MYRRTITTNVGNNSTDSPTDLILHQNYPFNPSTKIVYRVKNRESVSLKVFDVLGREVATLVDEVKAPGSHEVKFDARGLRVVCTCTGSKLESLFKPGSLLFCGDPSPKGGGGRGVKKNPAF